MEGPVAVPQDPSEAAQVEEATRPTEAAATNGSLAQMFTYSRWLHVGPNAEHCEDVDETTGQVSCGNPLHFHAWCRLPNKLVRKDIAEKADAAKAIKRRALNNPESGAYAQLEEHMTLLREEGDLETILDSLLNTEQALATAYLQAVKELDEEEEETHKNIDQQRERYNAIFEVEAAKPEGERSDEFRELKALVEGYQEALQERMDAIREPERQARRDAGRDAVLEEYREKRIEATADGESAHIFFVWMWFVGTFERKPSSPIEVVPRKFESIEHMQSAAPEVIVAMEDCFRELAGALGAAALGN